MAPSTEPDERDTPTKTLRGQVARTIERICITGAGWSIPLFLPVGCLFLTYLIGGYTAIFIGVWTPQYEFLSLSSDYYFAWLGFIPGTIVCTGTGCLIGLVFLGKGGDRIHTQLSILSSFIGFGRGAGVLRMTYMTVLVTL